MKVTKKQWIIGASVAAVLAAGGTGVVVNNQAHARAEKIEQQEKSAYTALTNKAKKAVENAEAFTTQKDVDTAHEAVKKLKKEDQKDLNARIEKVSRNWTTVKEASDKVAMAEKSNTKVLIDGAQKVIDTLEDAMTKTKKADLQKRLDVVKKKLKAKEDKAKADKVAKAKAAEAKEANVPADSKSNAAQEATPNTQEASAPQAQANDVPTYQGDNGAASGNYYGGSNTQGGGYTGGGVATPSTPAPAPGGGSNAGNNNPPSTNENPNYGHGADGGASQEDLDNQEKDPGDWGGFFLGK
ncbi:serine protease [Lactococcus garvieae]|uniref:serine protease n=1 Tax=Lactococcus garvieae TaxID=1363 RepID=UPI003852CB2B